MASFRHGTWQSELLRIARQAVPVCYRKHKRGPRNRAKMNKRKRNHMHAILKKLKRI